MNQKNLPPFLRNGKLINPTESNKQDVVAVTYEEIGLFPRSFSRVTDRFLQQIFSDVDNLIIHEYRFYRYLFFTTFKSLLILLCVPFLVNFIAKNYIVRPVVEYVWNSKQPEIFLNTYQQKRAFLELKEFEEKLYFESLIGSKISESKFSSPEVIKKDPNLEKLNLGINFFQKPEAEKNKQRFPENHLESDTNSLHFAEPSLDVPDIYQEKGQRQNSYVYLKRDRQNLLTEDNILKNIKVFKINSQKQNLNPIFSTPKKKVNSIVFKGSVVSPHSNSLKKKNLIYSFQKIKPQFLKEIRNMNSKNDTFYVKLKNLNRRNKNSTIRTLQEKTMDLAMRYNVLSIEAITNVCSDLISFWSLCYLLFALEIQINVTKSFLLEVFFGLDDSKKSLLILLVTDLLVGYHSSNIWELFFEFIFDHYGFAESQTGVFLLVATLPVLLDVLFKYLIFRHLNRSSPATVATYHAMIE